jgi:hypothetical protein
MIRSRLHREEERFIYKLHQIHGYTPTGDCQDSVVGIATRYGLGSPRIECQWRARLSVPSRLSLGTTKPPEQMGKQLQHGAEPPPSTTSIVNRLELYLCLPSVSAQAWYGVTFTFTPTGNVCHKYAVVMLIQIHKHKYTT